MTNDIEKDALTLLLRSKTALGRLNDSEVHAVLAFLESIGFAHRDAAPAPVSATDLAPAPVSATVLTPADQVAAQVAQVLPGAPAPSMLASLETIIEKDVKAFFEPAPIAPPPAQ